MNPATRERLFGFQHAFDSPVTLWITIAVIDEMIMATLIIWLLHAAGRTRDELHDELVKRVVSCVDHSGGRDFEYSLLSRVRPRDRLFPAPFTQHRGRTWYYRDYLCHCRSLVRILCRNPTTDYGPVGNRCDLA